MDNLKDIPVFKHYVDYKLETISYMEDEIDKLHHERELIGQELTGIKKELESI